MSMWALIMNKGHVIKQVYWYPHCSNSIAKFVENHSDKNKNVKTLASLSICSLLTRILLHCKNYIKSCTNVILSVQIDSA